MDYNKPQVYSFRIEPSGNQLALYYWQYGDGRMKAYIYRPLSTSYYQIAKDFIATYPQYQIDFTLHHLSQVANSESILKMQLNSSFYFDSTHFVNIFYFDLDMNLYGTDITTSEITYNLTSLQVEATGNIDLSAYGENFYSPLYTRYLYVPYQGSVTFQLRIYNNVYVLLITFSGNSFRCLVYEKYKKITTCCLEVCCNPNDYILI